VQTTPSDSELSEGDERDSAVPPPARRRFSGRRIGTFLLQPEYALPLVTLALGAYLAFANEYFFTERNLLNITEAVAVVGIAAAFATIIVIGGGIDLSPVVIFIMTGIVCQALLEDGVGVVFVVLIGIAAGGAIGLINGLLVALLNLNPFIVTLGTNFVFTGLAFVITEGDPLLIDNESFSKIGDSELIFGLPTVTVIMAGAFLAAFYVLRFTRYGVHVFAVGGDKHAARLSGVPVNRVTVLLYVLGGLAAGLSGVVLASASGSVAPFQAAGQNDLLTILAAVIIGGTALEGGRGTVIGTLVGILLLGMISNGLVLEDISSFWQPVITGTVLLLAIILGELRRRAALKVATP
jgi:ribose transport system permease protein